MIHLYLVRHSETDLNKKGVYYGRTDCSITPNGIKQTLTLKEKLKDIKFQNIYSSPLKRATDTMELLKESDNDIILDRNLIEMDFGQWEDMHYESIQKQYPVEWKEWCQDWIDYPPPDGENLRQVYRRIRNFLSHLLSEYKNTNENILVVSHQGCLRLIMSILLYDSIEGYWHFTFKQGCYTYLQIDDENHCTIMNINK